MMKLKPFSVTMLAFGGMLLIGMGIYFIFIRPPLLAEDLIYMNTSLSVLNSTVPEISNWLQKVFWVMGAYIFSTGVLTVFISFTSFRNRMPGVFIIIAFTGLSSIGSMAFVNFIIGSNFRWLLLIFTLPWLIALSLYKLHK